MDLIRKQAPAAPLVALTDLKLHLRVDHDDEDALIASLGAAAMAHIDGPRGILGRCIQPQVWALEGAAPGGWFRLPLPGVRSITALAHEGGAPQPVAFTQRRAGLYTEVTLQESGGPVSVAFTAETPEDVWPVIIIAIKLLVGHWYENREAVVTGMAVTTLPIGVERLLTPLKLGWV